MSWNASLRESPQSADKIEADAFTTSPEELEGGPAEQFELAVAKAKSIASSGAVGDPAEAKFHVSLSGHANPEHKPAEGYSEDCLTINVRQAPAE